MIARAHRRDPLPGRRHVGLGSCEEIAGIAGLTGGSICPSLADFAKRAGCADTKPISPHRLRHTWASDMLRCGISLPALKESMGYKDIRMTLRYLKVTQPDLQREF